MSNERSPRPSCWTTIGIRGMSPWLLSRNWLVAFLLTVSCNPMVARDITLPCDRDEAWDALTDPDALRDWLAETVELDLRPGGPATFVLPGGAERRAVVEEVERGEHRRRLLGAGRPDAQDGHAGGRRARQRDGHRARPRPAGEPAGGGEASRRARAGRAGRRPPRGARDALPPHPRPPRGRHLVDGRGGRRVGRAAVGAPAHGGTPEPTDLSLDPPILAANPSRGSRGGWGPSHRRLPKGNHPEGAPPIGRAGPVPRPRPGFIHDDRWIQAKRYAPRRCSSASSCRRTGSGSSSPKVARCSLTCGSWARSSSGSTLRTSAMSSAETSRPSVSIAPSAGTRPMGDSTAAAWPSQRRKM